MSQNKNNSDVSIYRSSYFYNKIQDIKPEPDSNTSKPILPENNEHNESGNLGNYFHNLYFYKHIDK